MYESLYIQSLSWGWMVRDFELVSDAVGYVDGSGST